MRLKVVLHHPTPWAAKLINHIKRNEDTKNNLSMHSRDSLRKTRPPGTGNCSLCTENQCLRYSSGQDLWQAGHRSRSGETGFSRRFCQIATAPVHRKLTSLRIFIDRTSIEVFGNDGEVCLTSLVYPSSKFDKINVTRY